jgi:murein DD-endopeptidase MepM/ murein hydrolase activator NlpD
MPRCRPWVAAVVVAAALLGSGTPASARDDRPSRAPSASDRPTTSSTVPGDPATRLPSSTVPGGIDVGHDGDHSAAVPPSEDIDVEPVDPENVNQVLHISTEEARARRDALEADLEAVDERIDRMQADIEAFALLSEDLVGQQRVVARRTVAARQRLVERAVGAYIQGNAPQIEAAYGSVDPNEVEERTTIVQTILEADQDEADRLLARRLEVTARLSRVLEQSRQTEAELEGVRAQRQVLERRIESAQFAVDVLAAGSEVVISGFVFPVADPHTFSSTYGAPRSGGRSHEGNDIFAPMGTPLLASENGVIADMGVGTLGGIKLWVHGESGTQYYYAHLIEYAAGITDGTHVRAGDVIGYVGNTGNAISTPPHLHYEIHPDGGGPIDPYPLLHAVDQIDGRNVLPNLYDQRPGRPDPR